MEKKTYIAIDLKSFYASVECVQRGLNPLTTNLVVADASRTSKTICLAVTPSLKAYGLSGRSRLFEVEQKVKEIEMRTGEKITYITAPPRMALYMKYSAKIYSIYAKYVSFEDIHVYSIDEVFMDVTHYLGLYKMSPHDLCMKMIQDVLQETGITATAGIATNLYLCKVAMDIVAKHIEPDKDGVRIAELDEQTYRELLWDHTPLTSFWRIGRGISKRLEDHGMYTMGDIARYSLQNEEWFFKEFGIDGEIIIDHAWGYEPCTIEHIKRYKPKLNSLSSGQVLSRPYSFTEARTVLKEMVEVLVLDLVDKGLMTDALVFDIGYDIESVNTGTFQGEIQMDFYGRAVPKGTHATVNLGTYSSSNSLIEKKIVAAYNQVVKSTMLIRRITIAAVHLVEEERAFSQVDLFSEVVNDDREKNMQKAIIQIKKKYGKNAVLKGTNLEEGATMKERNQQIGGHKA